ncbi:tRNA 2-selenouridine(34) synthase MnmH [Marinobacteraceae bacterium S3BR75-40.1]
MAARPDTDDYLELFLHDRPMIDLRAPVEFARGAFPSAVNLPLMSDEERSQVGTCYKEQGQEAAIELGHRLVSGELKEARLAAWLDFARQHPEGYLYCFRGGLRSETVQRWMHEAGVDYPRVKGGYKALRRFLLDWLDANAADLPLYIVSGRTGTGKTRLLNALPNPVDLEGIAHHRGSSFGRTLTPQPSQIDFENRVTIDLLKASHRGDRSSPIYLEDEGHLIGRCALPQVLRNAMAKAPLLILERSLEERIDVILEDYVIDMRQAYVERDGEEEGFSEYADYLRNSFARIRRRLGGARYQELSEILETALAEQKRDGSIDDHRAWIEVLLRDYYDPMYDYQFEQKPRPVAARGSMDELLEWAHQQ